MSAEYQPKIISNTEFAGHLLISYLNTLKILSDSQADGHWQLNSSFEPILIEIGKLHQHELGKILGPSGDHQELREALLAIKPNRLIELPTEVALRKISSAVDKYIKEQTSGG